MFEITIALIIFLFPLAYSPGPGNMFFAANGARFGFVATVPLNIGYHIATWLVTVVIGLGMITALNDYPNAFLALKISGAAYVLWLAWKLIKQVDMIDRERQSQRPSGMGLFCFYSIRRPT